MESRIGLILLMVGLSAVNGFCQSMSVDEMESFSFYYENDIFAGTDKNYSNAIKFAWVSADLDAYDKLGNLLPDQSAFWGKFLCRQGFQRNIGISFGQNMYTPENIDTRELIKDDRPYAGLTYLGFALHRKNRSILDTVELNLGIVGPASLAEDGQKFVHEITGSAIPDGWDNQLSNEFGFTLTFQRSLRFVSGDVAFGWGWDLIPHAGITAGTFAVYANTGGELRFGYHIPSDFGNALVRPGSNISVPVDLPDTRTSRWHRFSISAFLSIEGRAIAHNIFLDGNTFTDSHSVDKKPFVGDFSSGLSINYKTFKLTYAHVYRSAEFEKQDKGHVFGSLTLSYIF